MIAVVGNILAALFLIWLTVNLLRSREPLWKFIGGVLAIGIALGIVAFVLGVLYVIVKVVSH